MMPVIRGFTCHHRSPRHRASLDPYITTVNHDDPKQRTMSIVLDALIFATAWGHVLLAPYTKVEESFNLHAAHDVLMYGVGANAIPKVRRCELMEDENAELMP